MDYKIITLEFNLKNKCLCFSNVLFKVFSFYQFCYHYLVLGHRAKKLNETYFTNLDLQDSWADNNLEIVLSFIPFKLRF